MSFIYALLCSLVLVACAASQQQPAAPIFEITTTKPQDRVDFTWQDNTAYFDIRSPSGIGGARIRRTGGAAPARAVFRAHLAGLEKFTTSFPADRIEISVLSSGGLNPLEAIQRVNSTEFVPLAPDSPDWMPVKIESANPVIPLKEGFFRIDMPGNLAERDTSEFSIEWIDFFR